MGQTRTLSVLRLDRRVAFQDVDFIVAEVAAEELELDDADLVEEVVVVVVVLVDHELEVLAGHTQVYRLELPRLEAALFVAVQREVAKSAEQEVRVAWSH